MRSRWLMIGALVLAWTPWQGGAAAGEPQPSQDDGGSLEGYLPTFRGVAGLVWRGYVDPIDLERLVLSAIGGVADALDPFAAFVPGAQAGDFVANREAARRRCGMVVVRERGILYAAVVFPDGAAHRAGVRAGDVITAINGLPTRKMPRWQTARLLADPADAGIALDLLRYGEKMGLALKPRPRAAAVELGESAGRPILRLRRFGENAASLVAAALKELAAGSRSRLLIDLRGADPADVEQAYRVGALFASGSLGALLRRGEALREFRGEEEAAWKGRIVVLIDRSTLGPGEILASILRRKAGAGLVGEPTFGHAGRLKRLALSGGHELFLTDAFYAGPDGRPIDSAIEPDVRVRPGNPSRREEEDPILHMGLGLLGGE